MSKPTFSELDRRRRERRDGREPEPRDEKARERTAAATKQYLKQADGMFGKTGAGAERERLARALRDAHGTPDLAAACRAYRDALGVPDDVRHLSLFLDAGDEEIVMAALDALGERGRSGGLEWTPGLRSQVRILAEDPSDRVAEAAEELLALVG